MRCEKWHLIPHINLHKITRNTLHKANIELLQCEWEKGTQKSNGEQNL